MTDATAREPILTGTVIIPAYNEGETISLSLWRVVDVLRSALAERRWEIVVVDDGSNDATAAEAHAAVDAAATAGVRVRVLRHPANRGLGAALQTGFKASTGDVVVVVDCDLSYHPDHIPKLVRALECENAEIAIASPYMPGGSTRDVPPAIERRSRLANSFLAAVSDTDITTMTSMVRAYHGPFIRGLALKAMDDGINVETLYKTHVLRGRVVEVPATLDWGGLAQRAGRSRMRDRRTRLKIYHTLVHGVLLRPYLVFLLGNVLLVGLGGVLGLTAVVLPGMQLGLTVLAVSMTSIGILLFFAGLLSLQLKRSFEELYFLHGRDRVGVRLIAEDQPCRISEDQLGIPLDCTNPLSRVPTEDVGSPAHVTVAGPTARHLTSWPGLGT
jgi:dolichol-phosphate mannosyltransferase